MVQCNLHKDNYECRIGKDTAENFTLALYSVGTEREERVEVVLPDLLYYNLTGGARVEYAQPVCYERNFTGCRIVVGVVVRPGTTLLKFSKINPEVFQPLAIVPKDHGGAEFTYNKVTLQVQNDSVIKYTYGSNWINVSYVHSPMFSGYRQVQSWNKFGNQTIKGESMRSGLYLMSNNGKVFNYGGPATSVSIIDRKSVV